LRAFRIVIAAQAGICFDVDASAKGARQIKRDSSSRWNDDFSD
jgi:hypothetical protein